MQVKVLETAEDAAKALVTQVIARLSEALTRREQASLVLAGGSSFKEVYRLFSAAEFPWERVVIYFGDERCVPPEDERSNYRMAYETWLRSFPGTVYRMEGEKEPAQAASDYEYRLRTANRQPLFDVVLLGLGYDGHTASLFPPYVEEIASRGKLVGDTPASQDPSVHRLTLTPAALLDAGEIVVLACGGGKAEIVEKVLEDKDCHYPINRIDLQDGRTFLFLDREAYPGVVEK
jgi:6-phosphogluconolactonase